MKVNHGPFKRKGVDEYVKRMSKPQTKAVYDSTVFNILTNVGYVIPEDPASIYDPEQLYAQFDRFCEDDAFVQEDEYVSSAIRRAYRAFGYREHVGKLDTLKTETQFLKAIKTEKHAGVYFTDKATAWPRAWTRKDDVINDVKKPNPCLAGARTQRGNKTRLVWMFPLEMTILEMKFGAPLIENFKKVRTPMPYSLRKFELGARLEYSLTERNKVALDFSKFDASVPKKLIHVAFNILKTWFNMDKNEEKIWKKVENYFTFTPIVLPDGNMYTGKRKGVPSGSVFTQLIDSVVNYIIITAAMLKFDLKPHESRVHILGDDSVFSTNQNVNLKELRTYFQTLGFNLNIEKSEVKSVDETIHFIGFDWLKGVPLRDVDKALASMTQPENWRQRCKVKHEENARAYRLIIEMATLGANLYEVLKRAVPVKNNVMLHFKPEGKSISSYIQYQQMFHPSKIERNVATGLWI